MSFGITELLIILVIVVLLFGTKKLKSLGSDLGAALKSFRSAVKEAEETEDAQSKVERDKAGATVEGEVIGKSDEGTSKN